MEKSELKDILTAVPVLLKHQFIWSLYDTEADILYLHFKKPNHADNSEMTEDEIIIRYENNEIIGLTVLNASKRTDTSLLEKGLP